MITKKETLWLSPSARALDLEETKGFCCSLLLEGVSVIKRHDAGKALRVIDVLSGASQQHNLILCEEVMPKGTQQQNTDTFEGFHRVLKTRSEVRLLSLATRSNLSSVEAHDVMPLKVLESKSSPVLLFFLAKDRCDHHVKNMKRPEQTCNEGLSAHALLGKDSCTQKHGV